MWILHVRLRPFPVHFVSLAFSFTSGISHVFRRSRTLCQIPVCSKAFKCTALLDVAVFHDLNRVL